MNLRTKRRLLKLVDKLKTVPQEQFNMDVWRSTICGTVSCACGWACEIPEFKKRGLYLQRYFGESYELRYKHFSAYEAAAKFFGLNMSACRHLFSPLYYKNAAPTLEEVIERIQNFVSNWNLYKP